MANPRRVLSKDIIDKNGTLLLAKGTEIDDDLYCLLIKRNLLEADSAGVGDDACLQSEANAKPIRQFAPSACPVNDETIDESINTQTLDLIRRIPSIDIGLLTKASDLVSKAVYESQSQPWGLPLCALLNHVARVYTHSLNVAVLAVALSYRLKLNDESVRRIAIGALLHDVGKSLIPIDILNKPDKLSETEWILMREHPRVGADMIKQFKVPEDIINIILQHHERLDGTGYPFGLNESQISFPTQIVMIADVFDGITSFRPYRENHSIVETLAIMEAEKDISLANDLFVELKRLIGMTPYNGC